MARPAAAAAAAGRGLHQDFPECFQAGDRGPGADPAPAAGPAPQVAQPGRGGGGGGPQGQQEQEQVQEHHGEGEVLRARGRGVQPARVPVRQPPALALNQPRPAGGDVDDAVRAAGLQDRRGLAEV